MEHKQDHFRVEHTQRYLGGCHHLDHRRRLSHPFLVRHGGKLCSWDQVQAELCGPTTSAETLVVLSHLALRPVCELHHWSKVPPAGRPENK